MKTITIRVTKEDIKKANANRDKDATLHCAVATAMRRHGLRKPYFGFSSGGFRKNGKDFYVEANDSVDRYVQRFMDHHTVRPRNVTLHVQEG